MWQEQAHKAGWWWWLRGTVYLVPGALPKQMGTWDLRWVRGTWGQAPYSDSTRQKSSSDFLYSHNLSGFHLGTKDDKGARELDFRGTWVQANPAMT